MSTRYTVRRNPLHSKLSPSLPFPTLQRAKVNPDKKKIYNYLINVHIGTEGYNLFAP